MMTGIIARWYYALHSKPVKADNMGLTEHNIILYSSQWEIKIVLRSHSKAHPKIELYLHSILIIQSYKTHTHTHTLSLPLKYFESLHPKQMS